MSRIRSDVPTLASDIGSLCLLPYIRDQSDQSLINFDDPEELDFGFIDFFSIIFVFSVSIDLI